ncbi:MAG: hypothetical protein NTV01_00910 [Bacteroidia bacterium]|nr:hypothetical protein [Bacteroidia bacterium]
MKHLLTLLLLATLLTGCRKDHGYQDSGTILGFDYRKCMCCSGWFIKIEKDTLRFQTLPEGSTINLTDAKFPVDVYLDWHYPDPQCMKDLIIVTRMELKK